MARHSFAGAAPSTTLSSLINGSVTAIPVAATTAGWPNTATGPFVVTVDRGTSSEEKMLCSSYTSTQLTVTRGYDGTSGVTHQNGATVEVTIDATQIDLHDKVIAQVGTVTPGAMQLGTAATDGTQVQAPAAGDHAHAFPSGGAPHASQPSDAGANGTSTSPAAADHIHPRESLASAQPAVSTAAGLAGINTLNASRGDHSHPSGGDLLAVTQYAPGSVANYSTGNTSGLVAIDTTNLKVTFTAPVSGKVLVRLTALASVGGTVGVWALINGSTKYGPSTEVNPANLSYLSSACILVTGLTPGNSYTFNWAWWINSGTFAMAAGDPGGSTSGAPSTSNGSPATMEVLAL